MIAHPPEEGAPPRLGIVRERPHHQPRDAEEDDAQEEETGERTPRLEDRLLPEQGDGTAHPEVGDPAGDPPVLELALAGALRLHRHRVTAALEVPHVRAGVEAPDGGLVVHPPDLRERDPEGDADEQGESREAPERGGPVTLEDAHHDPGREGDGRERDSDERAVGDVDESLEAEIGTETEGDKDRDTGDEQAEAPVDPLMVAVAVEVAPVDEEARRVADADPDERHHEVGEEDCAQDVAALTRVVAEQGVEKLPTTPEADDHEDEGQEERREGVAGDPEEEDDLRGDGRRKKDVHVGRLEAPLVAQDAAHEQERHDADEAEHRRVDRRHRGHRDLGGAGRKPNRTAPLERAEEEVPVVEGEEREADNALRAGDRALHAVHDRLS